MEYYALLKKIHDFLQPRTYIEIGVRNGESMQLARAATTCIGIDPQPDIRFPAPPATKIFAETSDAFFADHDARQLLGGPVDLAFIDGMHLFEFALRDFINLERLATPQSVIMIHDCYPIDGETAARERRTQVWSGDVWKVIVCLKRLRPDLKVVSVDAGPTGLGVIYNLDPASNVLSQGLERICSEYVPMEFDAIAGDRAAALNRIDNDWPAIRTRFEPYRRAGAKPAASLRTAVADWMARWRS